jgi:putative nucleotidyltransferase with HDIG domain
LDNVRTLVLSVNVFSQFEGNSKVASHLPLVWDHSIAVSNLARKIASTESAGKALVDECFTAGLLHDLGKIVLLAELPRETVSLYTQASGASPESEKTTLGCTHAEVGAYLMSIWGLPLALIHAVAFHHCPDQAGDLNFSSLTAVHVADAIVSEHDPSPVNHDAALDPSYLDHLGLRAKESPWRDLYSGTAAQAAGASGKNTV